MTPYHFSKTKGFTPCYFPKSGKGFTLIETLVAIAILTVAIAGPLYTANRSIVATQNTRDQLTASYLAQEGIEYIRMMRDNAYLAAYQRDSGTASSAGWDSFLALVTNCGATDSTLACTLDPLNNTPIQSCSIGSCGPLYLLGDMYRQDNTGTPTQFTRTIQVFDIPPNEERIVSKVTWDFHGTDRSVTITDHLTPWQ